MSMEMHSSAPEPEKDAVGCVNCVCGEWIFKLTHAFLHYIGSRTTETPPKDKATTRNVVVSA